MTSPPGTPRSVEIKPDPKTLHAHDAARLFLLARGRGGENANEDLVALMRLLDLYTEAAYADGRKRALADAKVRINEVLDDS